MSPINANDVHANSSHERILVGSLGGLAAVLVKYLSNDHEIVLVLLGSDLPIAAKEFRKLWAGYLLFTPIMMLLGAMIGWISEETHRFKLFALGVSAPALITTWSSGKPPSSIALDHSLVSSAFAQAEPLVGLSSRPADPDQESMSDQRMQIAQLSGLTFGDSNDGVMYLLQAGSFVEENNAEALAQRINLTDKGVRAFVSEFRRSDGVLFFRVLIAQGFPIREALVLKSKLQKTLNLRDLNVVEIRALERS